jgi:maltose O-acetyltransferase
VTIGADAWIGACAVLLPNVTVGDQAVVATSAVVREDVAPRTVVGGIPAHFIKSLDPVPEKLLKRRTN